METTSVEMHVVIRKVKTSGTRLTLNKGQQITIQQAGSVLVLCEIMSPRNFPKQPLAI
jgi:hypothetical protein